MNPQQITSVIYGLYKESRVKGTLSPGSDNMIHVDLNKLADMANNDAIQSELSLKASSIQRAKSLDPLFTKTGSPKPAHNLPPAVPYNVGGGQNTIESVSADASRPQHTEGNAVLQPKQLLASVLGAYISKTDISEACKLLFPEGGMA